MIAHKSNNKKGEEMNYKTRKIMGTNKYMVFSGDYSQDLGTIERRDGRWSTNSVEYSTRKEAISALQKQQQQKGREKMQNQIRDLSLEHATKIVSTMLSGMEDNITKAALCDVLWYVAKSRLSYNQQNGTNRPDENQTYQDVLATIEREIK